MGFDRSHNGLRETKVSLKIPSLGGTYGSPLPPPLSREGNKTQDGFQGGFQSSLQEPLQFEGRGCRVRGLCNALQSIALNLDRPATLGPIEGVKKRSAFF